MTFVSGFVAVIGRPNAGKSTLVNYLVGEKVSIVTPRPQTTRNRIQGIVNRPGAQVILLDTPGLHRAENALGRQMVNEIEQALQGIDAVALVVDASAKFGAGDQFALEQVKRFGGPTLLLLNKVDRVVKADLLPLIEMYRNEHEFAAIVPISALTGDGVEQALSEMIQRLPEGEPVFPPEQFTDQPERFLAAEIIREKAILATREEVPHSLAVLVDSFEESEKLFRIRATIYVERDGQKGILIGKGGAMLKHIGTDARKEIEKLLDTKIYLELHVKVQSNWRDNPALVQQLDWRKQLKDLSE